MEVEILVPKVPSKVEIGARLVEDWCQIDEKREVGNCLPQSEINCFCGEIKDPVKIKDSYGRWLDALTSL